MRLIRYFCLIVLVTLVGIAPPFGQSPSDETLEELEQRLNALPEDSLEEFLERRLVYQPVTIITTQNNRVVDSDPSFRVFFGEETRHINAIRYSVITGDTDLEQDIRNRRRRTNLTYGLVSLVVAGVSAYGAVNASEEDVVPTVLAFSGAYILPFTSFAWLWRTSRLKSLPVHFRSDQMQREIFRYNVDLLETLEGPSTPEPSPDSI
jgi:hypothetical protein